MEPHEKSFPKSRRKSKIVNSPQPENVKTKPQTMASTPSSSGSADKIWTAHPSPSSSPSPSMMTAAREPPASISSPPNLISKPEKNSDHILPLPISENSFPPFSAPNKARSPTLFLNRELSWLEFNTRVLEEAENEAVPLLERVKFHAIVSSNLDEFFMVRVAGLKQQLASKIEDYSPDGMSTQDQLSAIAQKAHALVERQWSSMEKDIFPELKKIGIVLLKPAELSVDQKLWLSKLFENEIFPVLTPIAIDPGHPFPHVRNKSLNLGIMFEKNQVHGSGFGVVQVPIVLSRFVEIPNAKTTDSKPLKCTFVLLEDVIARYANLIFPGVKLKGVYTFRVTRNFDLEIDEEEAEDLLQTIQQELRQRERGNAVRLEVCGDFSQTSLRSLARALKLDWERDVYQKAGMLNMSDLLAIVAKDERRKYKDEPFVPLVSRALRDVVDPFEKIREGDILLHHPYESFDSIVELIYRAADDPDVLAIKQTLYRTGKDSPIVSALIKAAESGKQVTAVIELKARFDEASNILWARTLEQSGVNVMYGLAGLKTHAKCLLIVRREKAGLERYVHFSTGNYNVTTSRYYTDVGLLTSRRDLGEDASSFFNLLTGYSFPEKWNKLIVSPLGLHEAVLGLISRETEHAKHGRLGRIIAKMNSLVDEDVIEALYRASTAGVSISLIVRGICCLKPKVPKVSEHIEVKAIVDRFLEHSRVFYFGNGGKEEVYISSADWMPRNFHRRVELMIPILDGSLRARLIQNLHLIWTDTTNSWTLRHDGTYLRSSPDSTQTQVRSQSHMMELMREEQKMAEVAAKRSSPFQLIVPVSPLKRRAKIQKRKRKKTQEE